MMKDGVIPPNSYTLDGVLSAFITLKAEYEELMSAAAREASSLPPETFYALTGFKSDAAAREQFSLAGGELVLGQVSHHSTLLDEESVEFA